MPRSRSMAELIKENRSTQGGAVAGEARGSATEAAVDVVKSELATASSTSNEADMGDPEHQIGIKMLASMFGGGG